jgi:hypothetical protein
MATTKLTGAVFLLVLLSYSPSFAQGVFDAAANFNRTITSINAQVQLASPIAQAKVADLPQQPLLVQAKPAIELANTADRTLLCGKVTSFAGHAQSEQQRYSTLALVTIVLAAGLALVGSIASFLAKNKTAGIISLVVAAIVGFSNAYPVGPLADFYRSLTGEANALSVECQYTNPYTVTAYTSNVNQLKLLYIYEEKRPAFGSYRLTTDDLTKQTQVVRTDSYNVTVAQK